MQHSNGPLFMLQIFAAAALLNSNLTLRLFIVLRQDDLATADSFRYLFPMLFGFLAFIPVTTFLAIPMQLLAFSATVAVSLAASAILAHIALKRSSTTTARVSVFAEYGSDTISTTLSRQRISSTSRMKIFFEVPTFACNRQPQLTERIVSSDEVTFGCTQSGPEVAKTECFEAHFPRKAVSPIVKRDAAALSHKLRS